MSVDDGRGESKKKPYQRRFRMPGTPKAPRKRSWSNAQIRQFKAEAHRNYILRGLETGEVRAVDPSETYAPKPMQTSMDLLGEKEAGKKAKAEADSMMEKLRASIAKAAKGGGTTASLMLLTHTGSLAGGLDDMYLANRYGGGGGGIVKDKNKAL